jgi:hypothetical protein
VVHCAAVHFSRRLRVPAGGWCASCDNVPRPIKAFHIVLALETVWMQCGCNPQEAGIIPAYFQSVSVSNTAPFGLSSFALSLLLVGPSHTAAYGLRMLLAGGS